MQGKTGSLWGNASWYSYVECSFFKYQDYFLDGGKQDTISVKLLHDQVLRVLRVYLVFYVVQGGGSIN